MAYPTYFRATTACLCLLVHTAVAQCDDALIARFHSEAAKGWETYAASFTRCSARNVYQNERIDTSPDGTTKRMFDKYGGNLFVDGESVISESSLIESTGEPGESIEGTNSQYSFRITRKRAEQPNATEWLLKSIRMGSDKKSFISSDMTMREYAFRIIGHPIWLESSYFRDVIRRPEFKIVSAEWQTINNMQVAVLNYDCIHPVEQQPFFPWMTGTVRLLPDRNWIMLSWDVQGVDGLKRKLSGHGENQYDDLTQAFPRITRCQQHHECHASNGSTIKNDTLSTYEWSKDMPTQLDFTLTKYGLPEPVGVTWKKPTPKYVWLIAGALGLGLLGGIFRFLARRKTPAAKVPS